MSKISLTDGLEIQMARDKYNALASRNTFGLSEEERADLEKEFLASRNVLFAILEDRYK